MAGTMSEKELRISCGSTLAAEVDNPASGFTNAAAMARIGSTMYLAKVSSKSNIKIDCISIRHNYIFCCICIT